MDMARGKMICATVGEKGGKRNVEGLPRSERFAIDDWRSTIVPVSGSGE